MDDDSGRARAGRTAETSEVEALPPSSLDPRSAGCWIPFGLFAAFVCAAIFGFQYIVDSTGPWAIASARNAVAESGLPEADREALLSEIARLEGAMERGDLDARGVTQGVDGVLREPIIPLLALDDVRTRRVPPSGLTAAERAAAASALAETASLFDAGLLRRRGLIRILGPLAEERDAEPSEDAAVEPLDLDDDALRALVARAAEVNASVDEAALAEVTLRPIDRALLLERLGAHIDAIIAAD